MHVDDSHPHPHHHHHHHHESLDSYGSPQAPPLFSASPAVSAGGESHFQDSYQGHDSYAAPLGAVVSWEPDKATQVSGYG